MASERLNDLARTKEEANVWIKLRNQPAS